MIDGDRLKQARELNGLTQAELAERVGVQQSAIARLESGTLEPSASLLEAVAFQLQVRPAFFGRRFESNKFVEGSLLFRAKTKLAAKDRLVAYRYAQLNFEIYEILSKRFKPRPILIPQSDNSPELAARLTRSHFGLDQNSPVSDLFGAIEKGGVVALSIPHVSESQDAFSLWAGSGGLKPIITVLRGTPPDRMRFSVTHELAHLVMHRTVKGKVLNIEKEAHRFAGEFLLPKDAILEDFGQTVTLTSLARLKQKWKVSIQALIRRALDIERITRRQYSYLNQQLRRKGWYKNEPGSEQLVHELPRYFRRMQEIAYGSPPDTKALSMDFGLNLSLSQTIVRQYYPESDQYVDESRSGGTIVSFPSGGGLPSNDEELLEG